MNHMNETLNNLLVAALHDESIKSALLATRNAADPSGFTGTVPSGSL